MFVSGQGPCDLENSGDRDGHCLEAVRFEHSLFLSLGTVNGEQGRQLCEVAGRIHSDSDREATMVGRSEGEWLRGSCNLGEPLPWVKMGKTKEQLGNKALP